MIACMCDNQALHRDGLEGELSRARDELKGNSTNLYIVTDALQSIVYCDNFAVTAACVAPSR
jgi:hypothetical protein